MAILSMLVIHLVSVAFFGAIAQFWLRDLRIRDLIVAALWPVSVPICLATLAARKIAR